MEKIYGGCFSGFFRAARKVGRGLAWVVKKTWKPILIGALGLYALFGISSWYEKTHQPAPIIQREEWSYEKYISLKNAFRHYESAAGMISDEDSEIIDNYVFRPYLFWHRKVTRKQVTAALKRIQPALEELAKGAECKLEDFEPPFKQASFKTLFPEYSGIRKLARAGVGDAEEKIKKGKTEEGLERFVDVIEMGGDIGRSGHLIGALSGYAIDVMGLRPLAEVLSYTKFSSDEYRFVAHELERLNGEKMPFKEVMENEYVFHREGLTELLWMDYSSLTGYEPLWAYKMLPGVKTTVIRNCDNIWRELLITYDKPYKEVIISLHDVESNLEKMDPINRMIIPLFSRALQKSVLDKTILNGVMLMYALEAFKAERGMYPDSLQKLVESNIIKKVPEDSFSNKPFIYSKKDKSYLLYSVGPDMRDDKGKVVRPFWQALNKAGDIIFVKGINIWSKE